jgi:hypothetical protein
LTPSKLLVALTPKIPCGFGTKLGNFGHCWKNHFPQKFKCKKQGK